MKNIMSLVSGLLFGWGLAMSGMTDPAKVLGFLDISGNWDPALMFVMGGAVMVTLVAFRFVLKRQQPVCDQQFHLPQKKALDRPLIIGAVLFGAGWATFGYCPGPALAALVYLQPGTFIFVASMIAGMVLVHLLQNSRS